MRAFICRWIELELTMAMAMVLALEQLAQPIARSTAAEGSNVALVSASELWQRLAGAIKAKGSCCSAPT